MARAGAVYHVFERVGRARSVDVDRQWRDMMKQMGWRAADSFEEVVGRAFVVDEITQSASLDPVIIQASRLLSRRLPVTPRQLAEGFVCSIQQACRSSGHQHTDPSGVFFGRRYNESRPSHSYPWTTLRQDPRWSLHG